MAAIVRLLLMRDGQAVNQSLRRLMIRMITLSAALILLAPGCTRAAEVAAPNSCPRPTDQYGRPSYQILTGAYQSRGETPGGGKFVTIIMDRAAPISVSVTGDVFDVAGNIQAGTSITLVGYVGNSMSGAQPPYSCIEVAH
jgi:hypothetical protein